MPPPLPQQAGLQDPLEGDYGAGEGGDPVKQMGRVSPSEGGTRSKVALTPGLMSADGCPRDATPTPNAGRGSGCPWRRRQNPPLPS